MKKNITEAKKSLYCEPFYVLIDPIVKMGIQEFGHGLFAGMEFLIIA